MFLAGVIGFVLVQNRKQHIRDNLGRGIGRGEVLSAQCRNRTYSLTPLNGLAEGWAREVEKFLDVYLGGSYVERFRSEAGLNTGFTVISSREYRGLERGIRSRVARLHEFLREVGG